MSYRNWFVGGCFVVSLALAAPASALEFESFTDVENVCPDCDQQESDTITMSDGTKYRVDIIASNPDFLVVERYGEVRGVPKSDLQSQSFAEGERPSNLESQDQIVLKNGHVLTGSIVDESSTPGHFQLESSVGDVSFVVFKSQVQTLYRDGEQQDVDVSKDGNGKD